MDVGQKQIAVFGNRFQFILNVQGEMKVILPITVDITVFRNERVFFENFKIIEIFKQSIQYDNVWGNDQKISG